MDSLLFYLRTGIELIVKMASEEANVQHRKKFTRNLHVVKVVDVSFSKDGDRQYRVCWEETWEQEEDLLSSCKDLLRDYWENHLLAHISQEKETEATINRRDASQPLNYTADKIQEFLPSEDHSSPVLTPLYPFPSATTFSITEAVRTDEVDTPVVNVEQEEASKCSRDLPEQYKNIAFAKSVREKFAEKVPTKNNVDYVQQILSNQVQRSKQTEQHETKKPREVTVQQFLSYKKGVRVTCEICEESFADKKSLLRHKVCRHEKFSPHQCPICKKMFYKPGDVRRHVVIHMESRDYCCHYCQKTYKTSNHLQRHIKLKHLKNEVPAENTAIAAENEKAAENVKNVNAAADVAGNEGTETNVLARTIHEMNNRNNSVLDPILLVPDTNTLLNNTAALLNSASAILQNHTNLNDQFFSRTDVQMCLMDKGFF